MNELPKVYEQELFDNESVVKPQHIFGAIAISGIRSFFETKWKRRLTIVAAAALSIAGLSIEGNEYISRLRHQSAADIGNVAISTANQDITKQHLTEKLGNQIGQAAQQRISGSVERQAKEFADATEKEFIYQLEKDLGQNLNGDSPIGQPPNGETTTTTSTTPTTMPQQFASH